MDAKAARELVDATTGNAPASQGMRRTRSPHEFYRYPARFRPEFARAAINAFSDRGDVVLDPFVGGGTTLVESRLLGRVGIGIDLNQLATFVARVKTAVYSDGSLDSLLSWGAEVPERLGLHLADSPLDPWVEQGYLRNVEGPEFWRLRNLIGLARTEVDAIDAHAERELARCALLRTAQWALDMRDSVPGVEEFRTAFSGSLAAMAEAARDYSKTVRRIDREVETDYPRRTVVITGRAQDLANNARVARYLAPKLVLTSPPYPGVYVNYHRWKLHGRKETPAPYWIASQLDGKGLSYYTMSARTQKSLSKYFADLHAAFASIATLCGKETFVVQVVGFSDPDDQLPRYLGAMRAAGFREVLYKSCATDDDGRLWRDVPGRRWWAKHYAGATAEEVVLFHRLR